MVERKNEAASKAHGQATANQIANRSELSSQAGEKPFKGEEG